jgi:hypothetical protein
MHPETQNAPAARSDGGLNVTDVGLVDALYRVQRSQHQPILAGAFMGIGAVSRIPAGQPQSRHQRKSLSALDRSAGGTGL